MLRIHYVLLPCLLLTLTHCGKHETTSGTAGAVSGAMVGSAVAGRRDKGTGALVGALVGNYVGRQFGKSADKQERQQEERTERQTREMRQERQALARERAAHEARNARNWCLECATKVRVPGAVRCPDCGTRLVKEKVCSSCYTTFSPQSSYRYCPYCQHRAPLSYR